MHGTGVPSSHAHWPILVWVIQAVKGFLILCWNTQAISKKIIMAYCHWSVSGPNFLLVVVLFRVTQLPTSSKNWIARMTSRLFLVILADLFFKQLRRSSWKGLITLQSIFQKVWSFHFHRKWNKFTPFNFYLDYFHGYLFFLITKVVHLVMVTHVSNIFQEDGLSILSGYASLPNYVLLKSNVA